MKNITYYPMSSSPSVAYDLFGYKNIESDTVPFSEQIKNAKDAKANKIVIDFSNYKKPGDIITISDNGLGMNEKELLNGWLNIGTENKKSISNALGGKGIGRFSLFRLADKITVVSKKENENPLKLTLDKNLLRREDSIENLNIPVESLIYSEHFPTTNPSGTKIILEETHLIDFKKIYIELYNIIEPGIKNKDIDFEVQILKPKDSTLPNILDIEDALKYSNFNCVATYKGNQLVSYKFEGKLNGTVIYKNSLDNKIKNKFNSKLKKYKDKNIDLGEVKIKLHNFYFLPTYVSINNIPKNKLQNDFLNIYQGISVYREKFQIYGHGKNDWLKLAEKRVSNPSKFIDNKLTFGYISLTRPGSDALEETTNREGFISGNDIYLYFKESVEFIINLFNNDRVETISKMQKLNYKISGDTNIKTDKENPNNKNVNTNDSGENIEEPVNLNDEIKNNNPTTHTEPSVKEDEDNDDTKTEKFIVEATKKPRKPYTYEVLIDSSFECPTSTPLKIKQIIFELQGLKVKDEQNLYAVSLLLRCLIDISTQYARENLNLTRENENYNLKGAVDNVINYYNKKPTTRDKHLSELQRFINKEDSIKYFNGIIHDYDYRPTYGELRLIWNKFEFYISKCINTQ